MLTNQELTVKVCQISLQKFKLSFEHQAWWNSRLRTTGGRFFPKDLHLDFNPKMADLPEFEQIILHELAHYHLYRAGRGYQHKDTEFKQLLRQVGGLRFAPTLSSKVVNYHYICEKCGQLYLRQRRINTKKYVCGKCHARLILQKSIQ